MSLFDQGPGREALLAAVEGVHQADAVEWLAGLPPESVDLVITDPAYESLERHRAHGTTTRLKHWFPIFPNARFAELLAQVYRVLRPDSHFYFQCDEETADVVKPLGRAAGFRFWKSLIWDKVDLGMGYHYRCRCERILFFEKGKRKLNDLSVPDVLQFRRVRNGSPTEKPVELYEVLVRQSSERGEVVADPFLGSGACGEAALRLGRRFGGCDISEAAVGCATVRLAPWFVASRFRQPVHISGALASAGLLPDEKA